MAHCTILFHLFVFAAQVAAGTAHAMDLVAGHPADEDVVDDLFDRALRAIGPLQNADVDGVALGKAASMPSATKMLGKSASLNFPTGAKCHPRIKYNERLHLLPAAIPSINSGYESMPRTSLTAGAPIESYAQRRDTMVAQAAIAEGLSTAERSKSTPGKRVVVFGATGYIGRFVVKESIGRGYETVAFTRESSGVGGKNTKANVEKDFEGAEVLFGSVTDDSVQGAFDGPKPVDTVVVCLASRTGGVQDSFDIDYAATKRVLDAARKNKVRHFVLLSAICVQKPTLAFQQAKLKFEAELQAADDITHSIVRPTAFFKSLAAQIEPCKSGGPYVMFGNGELASCKPISERDLAAYMINCVEDKSLENKVLPIGGPGKALSAKEQGEILFKVLGREPNMLSVPVGLFDVINGFLAGLANIFPALTDTAEFGRIGKYYAVESMLVYDADKGEYLPGEFTPSYGDDTLEAFYREAVTSGLKGQELGDQAIGSRLNFFKKDDE